LAAGLIGLLGAGALFGQKKKESQSFAVVAGTVFHESGRSLPGAQVAVIPKPAEDGNRKNIKPLKTVSDSRGEFAVRVPAGSMRYTVRVEAKGFHPEEKQVTTSWDERLDIFFRLRPNEGEAGESK
jgi:hypothetical protein